MSPMMPLWLLLLICCIGLIALVLERERARRRTEERLAKLTQSAPPRRGEALTARLWHLISRPESLGAAGGCLLAIILATMLHLSPLIALPLAAAACVGSWLAVRHWRLLKLRKLFTECFPDAVDNLTRAVQAGVPIEKALASIGDTYEGELGRRFTLLVRQLELGVSFRAAARAFAANLNMPDVDFFCAVLALNRESGSRLTPMLISLSRTLRERRAVGKKLQVMTSETRSAAKVLSLLPVLVLAMEFFLNPAQFNFLFQDPTGRFILGCCGCVMAVGILVINRMSRLGA